jgi:predicted Zn-ribbon and HTH transcriptional regulator
MRFRFHACVSERAESNVTTAHERVVTGLVRTALPLRLRAMLIAGTTTVQNQHVVQKQVSKSTKALNMRLETLKPACQNCCILVEQRFVDNIVR